MKKVFYLFTVLFISVTFSAFQSDSNVNATESCFDWADTQLEEIVTDPDFGEPLTYYQEHQLWLSIYDFCEGGLQNFNG